MISSLCQVRHTTDVPPHRTKFNNPKQKFKTCHLGAQTKYRYIQWLLKTCYVRYIRSQPHCTSHMEGSDSGGESHGGGGGSKGVL